MRISDWSSDVCSSDLAVDLEKLEYKLDVRLNQQAYEKHDLPEPVSRKLLDLMDRLGLEYGAIDLRLTPGGDYVFFEVNPAGQFLFVEHACGHPISDAMAERQIGRASWRERVWQYV